MIYVKGKRNEKFVSILILLQASISTHLAFDGALAGIDRDMERFDGLVEGESMSNETFEVDETG